MEVHRRMDEYGNPIPESHSHGHSTGTTGYGTGTGSYGSTYPQEGVVSGTGQMQPEKERHGILHRSNSSSSSEDDGQGGRRKKGIKEKMQEKLPGGHKKEEHGHMGMGGRPTPTATHERPHEQKGIMDKMQEKLPGGQKEEHGHMGMGGRPATTTHMGGTGTTPTATHERPHEQKGIMDKIKEKLPGGHKEEEHGHMGMGRGTATTTNMGGTGTTPTATHEGPHEQKGIMDKIKEKLPGHH